MSFTYDPTTNVGIIRLRIFDTNENNVIFQDEHISAVLTLEGDNVKRAMAFLLETIATQQALILKVMTNLGLSTDGAKLAAELRTQAKDLRTQADNEVTEDNDVFDWAEQVYPTNEAEYILKQVLRGGG